ncbi:MAG: EF-hand domain-containing protein, partial [Bauldia sp.]
MGPHGDDGPHHQMMGPGASQGRGTMMGPGAGQGPGTMMGPGAGPGLGQGPMRLQLHDFATLDANGDGVISREEFAAAAPMGPGTGPGR